MHLLIYCVYISKLSKTFQFGLQHVLNGYIDGVYLQQSTVARDKKHCEYIIQTW